MNQEQQDLIKEIKDMQASLEQRLGNRYIVNAVERLISAHIKLDRLINQQTVVPKETEEAKKQ